MIKNLYEGKWMFAYKDQDYGSFSAIPNASRAKRIEVVDMETKEKQIFNTGNDADRYCGFSIGYTTRKFKEIGRKVFARDKYQLTLLD